MALRENLKALMEARGENARQVADETGLGYATVHGILSGERPNPTLTIIEKLAAHFGVTAASMLSEEGSFEPAFAPVPRSDAQDLLRVLDAAREAVARWVGNAPAPSPGEGDVLSGHLRNLTNERDGGRADSGENGRVAKG